MKIYSGDLATGLPPKPNSPEERRDWNRELARRVGLLCEHYAIEWTDDEEPDWRSLALKLAFTHVPGLRAKKKRGRKNRNDTEEAIQARFELLKLAKRAAEGKDGQAAADTAILRQLLHQKKIPKYFKEKSFNTLRGQLSRARKDSAERERYIRDLASALVQPPNFGGLGILAQELATQKQDDK